MRRSWFVFHGARHWVWRDAQSRIMKWGWNPPVLYRLTVGLNYFVSRVYYGYRIQVWGDKASLLGQVQEMKERVRDAVEKLVGYPPSEWWFPDTPNVGLDEVNYKKDLIGKVVEGVEKVSAWKKKHA